MFESCVEVANEFNGAVVINQVVDDPDYYPQFLQVPTITGGRLTFHIEKVAGFYDDGSGVVQMFVIAGDTKMFRITVATYNCIMKLLHHFDMVAALTDKGKQHGN